MSNPMHKPGCLCAGCSVESRKAMTTTEWPREAAVILAVAALGAYGLAPHWQRATARPVVWEERPGYMERIRVQGGWLYACRGSKGGLAFVPDAVTATAEGER